MKPTEIFRNSLKLLEPFETPRSSSYLLVCTEIAFSLSKSVPKSVYKSLSKSVWLLAQPACRWSFTNFRNFHSPMSGCSWSDCLAKRKPYRETFAKVVRNKNTQQSSERASIVGELAGTLFWRIFRLWIVRWWIVLLRIFHWSIFRPFGRPKSDC